MTDADHPLVTFALIAYNQEAFISQAVEAVLTQTYSPLEIILSDDASSDATATVIHAMATTYRGHHKVRVNINDRNLGVGAHVNKIFELAQGELLVLAAGDDISLPSRAERTVAHWLSQHRRPDALYCDASAIDAEGNQVGSPHPALRGMDGRAALMIGFRHPNRLLVLGACSAYTPRLYKRFGPLLDSLPIEDVPLAVRASLLGGIHCINEPLVRYRRNVSSWLPRKLPQEDFDRHLLRMAHRATAQHFISKQFLADVSTVDAHTVRHIAQQRFAATTFTFQASQTRRLPLARFIWLILANPFARFVAPAALFGLPDLHRWLFYTKTWLLGRKSCRPSE
ncbi:MAG: glycosyltransferase [Rhodanobacteraceae bacterium]